MHIDQQRHRVGDADGIGDLNCAAFGNAGGDDVLGEIARGIGRRAVDLGRILAGESAAAVRRVAAIGVDDDLAAGEAAVPVGPPTTKLPVGLTRKSFDRFGIQPSGSAEATASPIKSFTIAGEYFLPLRVSALCCVETTTLVHPTGLPSMYCTVTWLLASGCRSNSCFERRFSASTFKILCAK